jgi:D-amino-acid dehydrogenase
MRIGVIGAGIVGVTTAHALRADGHEVTVFERRGSAATESSFANAGFLAPGYVTPWAAPGMARKVMSQLFARDAAVRVAGVPGPALLGWLRRWRRACAPAIYACNRDAMLRLAQDSVARTRSLAADLGIEYEQGRGALVLLRDQGEVAQVRRGLALLADSGLVFHVVDAAQCRRIEPALEAATQLQAGVHHPDAGIGNCRQFALQLKTLLQADGVVFHLQRQVGRIEPHDGGVALHSAPSDLHGDSALEGAARNATAEPPRSDRFDAVVVCAAIGAPALLAPLRVRLPLQPVYGYSVTLPVRHFEAYPDMGPRAALMDERYKVAITRLGERVRVAGSAELGGAPNDLRDAPIATLYRVLQDWFPSAARQAHAQTWKGARPMLPDGPPAIGNAGVPGVWINTGHGSSGWALACGSARLLADLVAARSTAVDASAFSPSRWR